MIKPKLKFKTKLLMSYVILLTLSIVISISYWVIQFRREQQITASERLALRSNALVASIDEIFKSIKPILYLHVNEPAIENILLNTEITPKEEDSFLKNIMENAIRYNQYINSMQYISVNGKCISTDSTMPIETISTLKQLLDDRHGIPYVGAPKVYTNLYQRKIIPIYKEMFGKNGRSIGYIILNLDFLKFFINIDVYNNQSLHILILNKNGTEIYRSNHHDLYGVNFSSIPILDYIDNASSYYSISYKPYNLFGVYDSITQWYVFLVYDNELYRYSIPISAIIYIFIMLITIMVMCLIARKISIQFSKNVNLLSNVFKKNKGMTLFKISEREIYDDEIGELIINYNLMIDKLQNSLDNEYRSTIQKQELKIKMLSYQINPHFLYNCLNLINSLAIINGIPSISKISKMLGNMYHYTLEHDDMVTINDELLQLMDYLEIQKIRFNDNFDIDYDISPNLFKVPCMKFILQPIVENCFSHGLLNFEHFADKRKPKIDLIIYADNKIVYFICKDNGVGIDSNSLKEIRNQLNAPMDVDHQSIGLKNIHQRIKTYYGENYGITIESQINQYTKVTLCYPIMVKEEINEYNNSRR